MKRNTFRANKAACIAMVFLASLPVLAQSTPAPPPFGPIVTPGRQLATTDMTNTSPQIPRDIYRTPNPSSQDLATYAWLEFISLVSPASSTRGNTSGSFASSGTPSSGPLVWETYHHRSELFPYGAGTPVAPVAWNATPKYVEFSGTNTSYTVPFTNFNNLDEATQIGQNILFFPVTPGNPQPSTDAQVLFEAKVNQYEWSFVNSNYATLATLNTFTLPSGTVEVKAAWKPLSSIPPSQQYRYHTATVITYSGTDSNPTAQTATYALIALHIIHKSPNYPTFIYTTFSQVDNFQNQVTNTPTGIYYVPQYSSVNYSTFAATPTNFPSFTPVTGTQSLPAQSLPATPVTSNPEIQFNFAAPAAYPNGVMTLLPMVGPVPATVPVTQPVATTPGVAAVNQQALTAMQGIPGFSNQFVWQYYNLVGVQAVPTNDETSDDFYLANIVVESSQPGIQLFRGMPHISASGTLTNYRNQVNVVDLYKTPALMTSGGGCQGCHGVAQTQSGSDFSFLYAGDGGTGFSPEVMGVPPTTSVAAARMAKRKYFYAVKSPRKTPAKPSPKPAAKPASQ